MYYGSVQPIITKSFLVELEIKQTPGINLQQNFLEQPMLRGVQCLSVQCFMETQLTKSPTGKTVVGLVSGMLLTLTEASTSNVFKFPCYDLVSENISGLMRLLNKKVIDFPQSYITITDPTGLAINESVMFNFTYIGNPIREQ